VERAAAAGKHVMCEKPCAGSAVALRSMLEACRKAGVQFMDGTMFQHSSRLEAVRRVLDDAERFGELRRVSSAFSFLADDGFARENIRGDAGLEPMGCLGDLGWYNTRISLWALGWKRPVRVSARCHRWMRRGGGAPVPAEVTVELEFEGGVTAGFYCSFAAADQQWVQFSGTRGGLRLDDFVLPFDGRTLEFETRQSEFVAKGCDFRMRSAARSEVIPEAATRDFGAQESRMFRAFAECVARGARDDFWPRIALETQEVLDACMQAIVATGLSPSGSRED
jgi:predicted dehydrogenase